MTTAAKARLYWLWRWVPHRKIVGFGTSRCYRCGYHYAPNCKKQKDWDH